MTTCLERGKNPKSNLSNTAKNWICVNSSLCAGVDKYVYNISLSLSLSIYIYIYKGHSKSSQAHSDIRFLAHFPTLYGP